MIRRASASGSRAATARSRVGARLEKLLDGTGVRLLHDRRVPGTDRRTLTTSPSDLEASPSSTPRPTADEDPARLGGRTPLRATNDPPHQWPRPDQADHRRRERIAYVHAALAKLERGQGSTSEGALCFPDVDGLPLFGQIDIRGIIVNGPKRVARLAARAGTLDQAIVERVLGHLAQALPPA